MKENVAQEPAKERENRKKSLLGQKFGKLTVVERRGISIRKYANYLCQCECGNTIEVDSQKLRRGVVRSCGCVPGNHSNMIDLTGQRIGRLTVLKMLEERNYKGSIMWLVRCDCGTEKAYSEDILKNGRLYSCGCYRREEAAKRMHNRVFKFDTDHSREARKNAKSGQVGVYLLKSGKYRPYISMNSKRIYLGTYKTLEEAVEARRKAEVKRWENYIDTRKQTEEKA